MSAMLSVVKTDKDYDLNFTLTDSQGVAVNLTGATLNFNAQLKSDSGVYFSTAMTVVSATDGTCKYTVASTDFPVAGTYNCQIEASYSSGEQVTFPDITVVVEENVPTT